MDEIFSAKELRQMSERGHSRLSTRCYRCRSKKLHCTADFPQCSNCAKAGVECDAWVNEIKRPVPRCLLRHLQQRKAELEKQLAELRQNETIDGAEEECQELAKVAAIPFLDQFKYSEDEKLSPSLYNLYFNSTDLPPPFETMVRSVKQGHIKAFIEEYPAVDLYTIPREVSNVLMKTYMEYHLPQYPILSKTMLQGQLSTVYDHPENATDFDKAVVALTLAISAAVLTNKSEKRALSSSCALFSAALSHILRIEWSSKFEKLKLMLLISHYAFANPYAADIWYSLRDAIRLCKDMGLYQEMKSDSESTMGIDDRRRLFLVCNSMVRHLSAVFGKRFSIPQCLISVEYPTSVDDKFIYKDAIDYSGPQTKAAALHFHIFRMYETEVYDVLWGDKELTMNMKEWQRYMDSKIEQWFLKAEEFAHLNQLRYRLICKASLQARLCRRTRRVPNPTRASFIKLVNANFICIDQYLRDSLTGEVAYLLMAVYFVEEAAVDLLDVMWFEGDWILEYFTFESLTSKVSGSISLLDKFGERWPNIRKSKMVPYLKDLHLKVSTRLEEIANNNQSHLIRNLDPEVSSQLEYLLFPQNGVNPMQGSQLQSKSEDSGRNETPILDRISPDNYNFSNQSKWLDHFTNDSLFNIDDYILNY